MGCKYYKSRHYGATPYKVKEHGRILYAYHSGEWRRAAVSRHITSKRGLKEVLRKNFIKIDEKEAFLMALERNHGN